VEKLACINFRINYEIEQENVIQMMQKMGYLYRGENNKALKIEDTPLLSHEFIRNTKKGRYHLFIVFGEKDSGTEDYPQAKVFAHFDIIKYKKGKERHFPDLNEKRVFREIYRIEEKLIKNGIGFLEDKDRYCAHRTIRVENLTELLKILNKEYSKYKKGKYRKRFHQYQIVINLIEQDPYLHIVLVYADTSYKEHLLLKKRAKNELKNLLSRF